MWENPARSAASARVRRRSDKISGLVVVGGKGGSYCWVVALIEIFPAALHPAFRVAVSKQRRTCRIVKTAFSRTGRPQRHHSEHRGQWGSRVARGVGFGEEGGELAAAGLRQRLQRFPELGFERHAGAMSGQSEAALDQHSRASAQFAASATTGAGSEHKAAAVGASVGSAALPIA